jgi:hypothetical protein
MAATRISVSLMLLTAALVWLAPSLVWGREGETAWGCSITRPDGFKEPGTKNDKGECCSALYADDCIPPASGQPRGAMFYGSFKH